MSGKGARDVGVGEYAEIGAAAIGARRQGPLEFGAGLQVGGAAEIALEHFRSRGRESEFGDAALEKRRSQGDVLRPGDGTVAGRQVLQSFADVDTVVL